MNATEVTAALHTVEQDHRLVLDRVQALKDAVRGLFDTLDEDPRPALARLRDSNKFFATQFAAHLEEEETALFPLLERDAAGGAELVGRLRREHAEIRRRREELGNCLDVALGLDGRLPRMVVRDLVAYGWELWDLLDEHAHTETRAVHQCIARSFGEVARPRA
jgi:hemerythrin-like domain-containing protein